MTPFVKYEYRDLSKPDPVPTSNVKKYEEPKFELHNDVEAVVAVVNKHEHFALDEHVSNQLGLGEREKKAAEARIQKELESRWEVAAGKAEVAGYTKGLEEGKKEAYQAELPRIKERVEKLDFLLEEINSLRSKIFTANEAFLMDLIAQVAGMVALKEVALDQDYVKRLVIALLHQVGTKEDIKIFLSQQDHANAESLYQAIQKEFGKLSNTTIEPSEEVPSGGCKIETRFGVVDASVITQVESVMKSLKA